MNEKGNEIKPEEEKNEIKPDEEKNEIKPEEEKNEIKPEEEKNDIKPEEEKNEIIKEEKNLSNSSNNLINMKTYKSYIIQNNIERKSIDSDDNKKIKKNIESRSSVNLNHLSSLSKLTNLYRNYIQQKNFDEENLYKRRSIFPGPQTLKRLSINENEEILEENLYDNLNLDNVVKDRITDAKKALIQYIDEVKKKLDIKYNNYINDVNKLLYEKEKKLSKLLDGEDGGENFINYANNNLFKQLDDILQIHDYIFNALEDHFNLLFSFLEQSNLINQKKPIEYFIYKNSNDILNCWLLNKLDFEQIDLSKIIANKEFSDLFAGYFSKMKNNDFSSISLQKNNIDNFPLEIKLMNKNINKVKKIKFIGLNNDDIININKDIFLIKKNIKFINEAKKVRSLSIINCDFKSNNQIKISFPVLKTFKLKNSLLNTSYLFAYIINDSNTLIKLHLEKVFLTDNGLKIFFLLLSKKNSVQTTLKSLSFKGNLLTKISLENFNMNDIEDNVFKNLQYLDFSKNNIYEFSEKIFRLLPELKVLDLTDNNISNRILFDFLEEGKKIFKFFSLLSNNIFIHNNYSNNIKYVKYVNDNLSSFQHEIKKISFCLLFNQNNMPYLTKLKISPAVKISLRKLDLSFCGINDENLWKFFKNNFGLFNLEILNLSNNCVTDKFFGLCNGTKGDILFEKIKVIDLSFNEINMKEIENVKSLENFVDNHHELKKIKLQNTNFVNGFINLMKKLDFKEDFNIIIPKFTSIKLKFVVESDLNNKVNSEFLPNLLSFKDKTY